MLKIEALKSEKFENRMPKIRDANCEIEALKSKIELHTLDSEYSV